MLITRTAPCLVVFAVSMILGGRADAGQPTPPTAEERVAALEARVRELEAIVRTLADERLPRLDAPAAATRSVTPAATNPAPGTGERSPMPQELLPSLGQIGAVASFLAGGHSGPFGLDAGSFVGGAVELPLFRAPGGLVRYEFRAGLGRGSTAGRVTSNVAQVANLAALANLVPGGGAANVDAALAGRPPAPFPVRYDVDTRLQLLEVVPFGLKYVSTSFDRFKLRPYVAAGVAAYVTITNQRTGGGDATPFAGALIGGQLAAASELVAQGTPSGQGGIDLGVQTGGGVEYRVWSGLSFGVDVRAHRLASGRTYVTTATRTGFHF